MFNKNQINVQKNQKYIVKIEDFGSNGEGIAKIDGFTVFVPFAIVGEEVEIVIILIKSTFAIGKVLNIIKSSPNRVEPKCPYFKKCGGCQLQHMNYLLQLDYKRNFVQNCMNKYYSNDANVENCVPSVNVYNYRNKFAFPVQKIDGKICVGMYRINSHDFIKIDDCAIQTDCKNAIDAFVDWANEYNVEVYNESEKQGVRHIIARIYNNDLLFVVVSTKKMQKFDKLYEKLSKNYNIVGLINNINTKNNNVIIGDKDYVVYGENKLSICENGINYTINSHSFMQVNNEIKTKLYDAILNNIQKDDIVIDAYSGAGVLSAMMAKKCQKVYGIEIVKEAVDDANMLKRNNNLRNLENLCADCAVAVPEIVNKSNANVIVLDPPRKGCDKNVAQTVNNSGANKIIYVSCNPATLARDLNYLNNYEIVCVTPYDMFPQTANVETLVILNKIADFN